MREDITSTSKIKRKKKKILGCFYQHTDEYSNVILDIPRPAQRSDMWLVTFSRSSLYSPKVSLIIIITRSADSLERRKWIGYLVDPSPLIQQPAHTREKKTIPPAQHISAVEKNRNKKVAGKNPRKTNRCASSSFVSAHLRNRYLPSWGKYNTQRLTYYIHI
jgi:hypothetical protein